MIHDTGYDDARSTQTLTATNIASIATFTGFPQADVQADYDASAINANDDAATVKEKKRKRNYLVLLLAFANSQ